MPDHLCALIIQLIFILLSALITVCKTAVDDLSETRIDRLEDDGENVKRLRTLSEKSEKTVFSLNIWQIFCSLSFAAATALFFAGDLSDVIFSSRKTVFILLSCIPLLTVSGLFYIWLGWYLPKKAVPGASEKTADKLYKYVAFFSAVIAPFTAIISFFTDLIIRLSGVNPEEIAEEVTEEEIRDLVEDGEEDGNIGTGEREMIENIFEFNNITAADIMVHRTEMFAIEVDTPNDEIVRMIDESGYSRFPVYDGDIDNIIGVLSSRIFLLNIASQSPKPLREIVYEPFFIPESVHADALFRDMKDKKIHMSIVLDEYGGTFGIVTMEDLLESIVGNIYDETDETVEETEITKTGDNEWKIAGTALLEDIEEQLDVNIDNDGEDFTTLSGLIFSKFITIPADGETPELDIDRLHIKVLEIAEHRVTEAVVTVLPVKEETDE